jgi:hypothetical protein
LTFPKDFISGKITRMRESFLYYIWQFQYFDKTDLITTDGESVEVIHAGFRNPHSGPDFFNGKLRIGSMEWIGNIEIHIYSSEWTHHKHDHDDAYNNVILHVVWSEDKKIVARDGSYLPTLELKNRVSEDLLLQFKKLINNPETIPCSSFFARVNSITKLDMLDKSLTARLEAKAGEINQLLQRNRNDWEETCYQLLCKNFGFKVNTEPFQQLSRALPYRILMKHADKHLQIEALLFGQAGFLEQESKDEYHADLKREYALLSRKFNLESSRLNEAQWRFLRLRPANFPSTRLAQLASLLFHHKNIFSGILSSNSHKHLLELFTSEQSVYWQHHYQFFAPIEKKLPSIGKESIDNIIINSVVPILVAYGKSRGAQHYVDKGIDILQQVPSEKNSIIEIWKQLGVQSKSAFYSQALIELHNNYCLKRRCLDCSIGFSILQPHQP